MGPVSADHIKFKSLVRACSYSDRWVSPNLLQLNHTGLFTFSTAASVHQTVSGIDFCTGVLTRKSQAWLFSSVGPDDGTSCWPLSEQGRHSLKNLLKTRHLQLALTIDLVAPLHLISLLVSTSTSRSPAALKLKVIGKSKRDQKQTWATHHQTQQAGWTDCA